MANDYKKQGQDLYAAPMVEARVTSATGSDGDPITVEMLIDTGADISSVPKKVIDQLVAQHGGIPRRKKEVGDFKGDTAEDITYFITITLNVTAPQAHLIDVLAIEDDEVPVLGRDVLKEYCLCFDGPNATWGLCPD